MQAWFDSSTERSLAVLLDDSDDVHYWARLERNDLPILWQSDGREYNPDFAVVEHSGTHWLVEAKMDKEMNALDVKGKELAAKVWANTVSLDTETAWRYLLVGETDVAESRGSWAALRQLGRSSSQGLPSPAGVGASRRVRRRRRARRGSGRSGWRG